MAKQRMSLPEYVEKFCCDGPDAEYPARPVCQPGSAEDLAWLDEWRAAFAAGSERLRIGIERFREDAREGAIEIWAYEYAERVDPCATEYPNTHGNARKQVPLEFFEDEIDFTIADPITLRTKGFHIFTPAWRDPVVRFEAEQGDPPVGRPASMAAVRKWIAEATVENVNEAQLLAASFFEREGYKLSRDRFREAWREAKKGRGRGRLRKAAIS